jgi:hypothetical protein
MRVAIEQWACLAPGLSSSAEWRAWAREATPPQGEVHPDVAFLPAMQRRRCDGLSRMMLAAANGCCDESLRGDVSSVFASRHGSFATTIGMLEKLARDEPLSPTNFSHSVHNTQAGLFSIWAGNQQVAQSLASRNETFEHGFLEAMCLLTRSCGRPVLFVTGDEALPEPVADLSEDPHPPYALALLLRTEPGAHGVLDFDLEHTSDDGDSSVLAWPKALEFLRWWLSGEEELRLGARPRVFVWRRAP